MVLQRDRPIPVWGWTDPGAAVTVTMRDRRAVALAGKDGRWEARLGPFPAGGPDTLVVAGARTVTRTDVLVGDVWLCSGQSNMQFGLRATVDGAAALAGANDPGMRLCTVARVTSPRPQPVSRLQWEVCTPAGVMSGGDEGFSAVAFHFGRRLRAALGVPIGLVHASWGGTCAEDWISGPALARFPEITRPAGPDRDSRATLMSNGMIAPVTPFGLKGVLWYQGESNAGRAEQYARLLPALIADWRARFRLATMPFLIVQLPNFQAPEDAGGKESWAELRAVQARCAATVPHAAVVVTIDLGDPKDIHPRNKRHVGRRAALVALHEAYGRPGEWSGPVLRSAAVTDGVVHVSFDHADGLRTSDGGPVRGFELAAAGGAFVPAEARLDGEQVVVRASGVAHPAAVRYAWAANPACNLYNAAGLPAAPFQSALP